MLYTYFSACPNVTNQWTATWAYAATPGFITSSPGFEKWDMGTTKYQFVPCCTPKTPQKNPLMNHQFISIPHDITHPIGKKNIHFVGESLHFSLRKFLGSDPKRPGAKIWTAPSVAVRPRGSVKTSRAAPCVRFEPRRICQKSQLSRYVFHICCSIYTDD